MHCHCLQLLNCFICSSVPRLSLWPYSGKPSLSGSLTENSPLSPVTPNLNPLEPTAQSPSDPVVREMMRGVLCDVGGLLNRFNDIIQEIRTICDDCVDDVFESKKGISIYEENYLQIGQTESPVGKAIDNFPSPGDYLYFAFLSVINRCIWTYLFSPFHPCATCAENDRCVAMYKRKSITGKSRAIQQTS